MRLLAALAAALFVLTPSLASANGTTVHIPLSRLAGVANFGQGTPVGQADITAVEGDVDVQATGLERLTSDLYQAWLVNSKTGDRLSIAKFNATAEGTAKTHSIVQIGNREFDLFVVTVEPEPDPTAEADQRIVLAGYWPGKEPGAQATAAAATATVLGTTVPTAAATATPTGPSKLPNTGDPGAALLVISALTGAGALALARRLRS